MQCSMVPWMTWSARMRTELGGGEAEGPASHKAGDDLKDSPSDVAPLPDRLESSAFWCRPQRPPASAGPQETNGPVSSRILVSASANQTQGSRARERSPFRRGPSRRGLRAGSRAGHPGRLSAGREDSLGHSAPLMSSRCTPHSQFACPLAVCSLPGRLPASPGWLGVPQLESPTEPRLPSPWLDAFQGPTRGHATQKGQSLCLEVRWSAEQSVMKKAGTYFLEKGEAGRFVEGQFGVRRAGREGAG